MLSRRCNVHRAVVPSCLRMSAGTPAMLHGCRFMSRFSVSFTTTDGSTPFFSSGPSHGTETVSATTTTTANTMEPPQKAWAQRWEAIQTLVTAAPSYFSSIVQSRYTRTPANDAFTDVDAASSSPSPSSSTSRVSATLALLRRLAYLDRLYALLGLPSQHAAVRMPADDRATLASLLPLVWLQPASGAVRHSIKNEHLVQSKDGGNNPNDNGGGNKGKGGGDNNSKKKKDSVEGGEEDEERPEDWIVPRTCLFVLLMIALTVLLYQLSRPSGKHTGWVSLNQHAGEIREVALYENYLQVYLDEAKVYLGLVSDHDTQHHLDELAANYRAARAKAVKEEQQQQEAEQKSKKAGTDDSEGATAPFFKKRHAAADKPEELDVTMKGRPFAETALVGVGVFAWVVPFIFFPVFVMFLSQYIGKSMSYAVEATKGKTKAKEMIFSVEKSSTTRFRDIAGMKEPKKEITEIVDFLRHPERYTRLGAKIPTGAMLLGPPGTGKTLLAKAVAGESGVAFIPAIGSDFVELYVGMGALRVRQLFKEARKQRCIIYIDEIDAIGLKRQGAGHGEKQEQEQTLNELLTQLDGFSTGKRGDVMVLASSNVAQEALDPALIRPGRFDRIIHVDTPVIAERIDIFKVHLSKLKLTNDDASNSNSNKTEEGKTAAKEETTPAASAEKEEEREAEKSTNKTVEADAPTPSSTEAASSTTTTTTSAASATTGNSLIVSQVEAEKKAFEAEGNDGSKEKDGTSTTAEGGSDDDAHDFDFRALLMQKSDAERAMIDVYAQRMSNLCPGFVGADIANVCNEGAILAAREGADHVDINHLERSIDRVLAGIEHRSRAMSNFEKNVVAHHEAGHAVAGWFLNRADPLMKVSIVPRGGSALGYAQYLPNENFTRTAKEIRDSISVTLGGRVAEQIFFDHLSTGASDDLRKVGRMAYQYVASFSPGSVYPAPGTSSTRLVKPFGANKSNDFDRRAKALVDDVYADTLALLTAHKDDMKKLADHLLKHELLTYSDVVHYLGARSTRQTDKKKGV